jgi:hypothetical protein
MGERRYISTILDLSISGGEWSTYAPAALPPVKEAPVSIEWEAGWAPESVWMLWSKEKYLAPVGNRTPAVQPTAISSEVFWLPMNIIILD